MMLLGVGLLLIRFEPVFSLPCIRSSLSIFEEITRRMSVIIQVLRVGRMVQRLLKEVNKT